MHPFRVPTYERYARETDTSCPLCDSFGRQTMDANRIIVVDDGDPRPTRPRKFCIRRLERVDVSTVQMSGEIIRIRGAQPTTTLSVLSVPWNRAVAQCYSTGERKLQYEKSINSWPFLCKEDDRATTRHSFGREPI